MKTNKEKIFDYIVDYSKEFKTLEDDTPKFDTRFLSEKLNMQRTNISSVLNQLVEEGKLSKTNGRPVMFYLSDEQNTELGRAYIRKAADQGYIEAMCVFAMEARLFDLTISAHYLRWAARKTEPKAIHMYGLACEQNIGYPKDTAIDYFRMGTECGYMKPMNNLATRCGDIHMANTLWRRAAEMGSEHGAYNLAVSYKLGRGIEQDDVQAARWMKMASDLQYSPAMFDYAIMLRDGIGCEKDEEAAEKLCELAGTKKLRDFTMRDQLMRVTEENIATAPKGE